MAAWEISKLPWLQEDQLLFTSSRSAEHMWSAQASQRVDENDLIHVIQKELTPETPKITNSISNSFPYSKFLINAITADSFAEDTNLHPLINFPEIKQVALSDSPPASQSFSATYGQSSPLRHMGSTSQSSDDFSSIRNTSSSALPLSTSSARQSSFKNDCNFQLASLGDIRPTSMTAVSRTGMSEIVNSHGVASTAIGTVPPPPRASDAPPSAVTAGTKRVGKKRSRASRRPPTTVLEADSSNFRAMVQQLTGIPTSSFFSSPLQHTRLEHQLGSTGLGSQFATPGPRPPALEPFPSQSSISGHSMVDRTSMQALPNPISVPQASYPYGDHPLRQANEVNPFSFMSKRPVSESQQQEMLQPRKISRNFATVSEALSAKHFNPSSLFQSLGYSDHMAALLSARDQAAAMPSDRSHVWDPKPGRSFSSNIGFDEVSNVKLTSIAKSSGCPEEQFHAKPMMLDHLRGGTDVDICSSSKATSPHVVDSWLSHTD